jgi:hypothetical protein
VKWRRPFTLAAVRHPGGEAVHFDWHRQGQALSDALSSELNETARHSDHHLTTDKPWIHFEAGRSSAVDKAYVSPFLFNTDPRVVGPLAVPSHDQRSGRHPQAVEQHQPVTGRSAAVVRRPEPRVELPGLISRRSPTAAETQDLETHTGFLAPKRG